MTGCPTTMCYLQEYTGDSPLLCVKVGCLDAYYHTLQLRKQDSGQDNQFTINLQQPVISECICLSRSTQQQQQKSMAATLWVPTRPCWVAYRTVNNSCCQHFAPANPFMRVSCELYSQLWQKRAQMDELVP